MNLTKKFVNVAIFQLILLINSIVISTLLISNSSAQGQEFFLDIQHTNLQFPSINYSTEEQSTTKTYDMPLKISSTSSTTGGFTLNMSITEFINDIDQADFIPYTLVEVKTGEINSQSSTLGFSTPLLNTYSTFEGILDQSDPKNILSADSRSRSAGNWELTLTEKITIPAQQRSGFYTAVTSYTLI